MANQSEKYFGLGSITIEILYRSLETTVLIEQVAVFFQNEKCTISYKNADKLKTSQVFFVN